MSKGLSRVFSRNFNKYLLNVFCVLAFVISSGDTARKRIDKKLLL